MLLITAAIWGFAFVAQSTAMDSIGPFTFQGIRSVLGGVILIPVFLIIDYIKKKEGSYKKMTAQERKTLIKGGLLCGLALCTACCFQQMAIAEDDNSGKAGFITAMYILIVPVLGLFFKKKPSVKLWFCIGAAVVGMYFLCIKDGFTISRSDILLILCAVAFSVQIMLVDHFSPKVDGVRLSCIQFLVTGLISSILMLIFEEPSGAAVKEAWIPILYAGIGSCGIAYTFQIIGQKYTEPVTASLIMSLESAFALLGGMLILKQIPMLREWIGIGLMFTAIMVSQLPDKKKKLS